MMRIEGSTVCRALARPRLFAGIDKGFAAMIWGPTLWLALVIGDSWRTLSALFVPAVLLHYVMRYVCRREPLIFRIYRRYMYQADRYVAWPRFRPRRGLRPIGWGRTGWKG